MKRVLNTLEILDRYNFNRADSTSSIDSVYSKIFAGSTKSGGEVHFGLLPDWLVKQCSYCFFRLKQGLVSGGEF